MKSLRELFQQKSGFRGHKGRPGLVGGSVPAGTNPVPRDTIVGISQDSNSIKKRLDEERKLNPKDKEFVKREKVYLASQVPRSRVDADYKLHTQTTAERVDEWLARGFTQIDAGDKYRRLFKPEPGKRGKQSVAPTGAEEKAYIDLLLYYSRR